MSQKLSFSSIAATLAALSASGLIACGGETVPAAESPADAKEVPASMTNAAAASDEGPMKAGVAPSEGAMGSTPAPESPKVAADATEAPASTPAAATPKDEKPKAPAKKKAAGAKAGCGAGTCG